MKIAILKYASGDRSRNYNVRPGQSVLIGASNSADIKLANTEGVAPQHCEVKFEDGAFSIKNLSRQKETISVNGNKIESGELADQDRIEIGNNELTVEIEDNSPKIKPAAPEAVAPVAPVIPVEDLADPEPAKAAPATPASVAPAEASAEDAEEPEDTSQPVYKDYPNGIRAVELDVESGNGFVDLVHPLFASVDAWGYGVFYNHLLSKLSSGAPSEGNLLEGNEDPYVQSNDLYFQTSDDKLAMLKLFGRYAEKQAAVLCLLKNSAETKMAEDAKMMATWLMNPVLLEFHVLNGSDLLISKIFGLVDALVFSNPETKKDLVLINDISVKDWDSLVAWVKGGPAR